VEDVAPPLFALVVSEARGNSIDSSYTEQWHTTPRPVMSIRVKRDEVAGIMLRHDTAEQPGSKVERELDRVPP
jgi:hypothetical protein